MLEEILFCLVIIIANVFQGITGFAGTILAMPLAMQLVGYSTAKPVLNLLGLLSGIYVFYGNEPKVNWKEFRKIVLIMAAGIVVGMFLKSYAAEYDKILFKGFGIFVGLLAIQGLVKNFAKNKERFEIKQGWVRTLLLVLGGLIHGMFVCGGPLIIGYCTAKIKDKDQFRTTVSTLWIVLNTIILVADVRANLWTNEVILKQWVTIPCLFLGMFIGGRLAKRMSQRLFTILTYILLLVSGVMLFIK